MNKNRSAITQQTQSVLNPRLWDKDRLKSQVRGALLRIAQDFYDFVDIEFPVQDIVITGGNANYNYTEHSDIDLHLITDYASIDCDRAASELFDSKRRLYNLRYDLRVQGIPVELYVEDHDQPAVSAGSYSLTRDRWLKRPSQHSRPVDQAEVQHYVQVWQKILAWAVQTGDRQTLKTSVELLKQYRRRGLATADAEFSTANLVFKELRNLGIWHSVIILLDRWHDQDLSTESL